VRHNDSDTVILSLNSHSTYTFPYCCTIYQVQPHSVRLADMPVVLYRYPVSWRTLHIYPKL